MQPPPPKPPRKVDTKSMAKNKDGKKFNRQRRMSLANKKKMMLVKRWHEFADNHQSKESAKYIEKIIRYLVKKDEVEQSFTCNGSVCSIITWWFIIIWSIRNCT